MSTMVRERYPLGLPAGSVRAILAISITATFCVYVWWPSSDRPVPAHLYFLLALVLSFFSAHGATIGGADRPSPLHLPRGTFRILVMLALVGTVIGVVAMHEGSLKRFEIPPDQYQFFPYYFLAVLGGFGAGWLLSIGPWRQWPAYQDMQAWLSMMALLALSVETILSLVIDPQQRLLPDRHFWDTIVLAIYSLYFGSRS